MISVDNWLNETTRHAHVVLPGLSPLERAHCDDLYWMYAIASCVKWSDPVLAPPAGRPQEWEIMLRLAGALLGTPLPDVDVPAMDDLYTQGIIYTACQAADTPLFGRDPEEVFAALRGRGPGGMIDLGVRVGPWGEDLGRRPGGLTLEEVRRHPDGLRLGELEGGRLNEVLTTPSGRIELMHPLLAADIPRLHAADQPHRRRSARGDGRTPGRRLHHRGFDPGGRRSHRRDDGRRGVTTPRLGSRCRRDPARRRQRPSGANTNMLNPAVLIDVPSNTQVVNGVPCSVAPVSVGAD